MLGRELPPLKIMPTGYRRTDDGGGRIHAPQGAVVDGVRLTHSDLYGIMQEDPRIAYEPRPSATSTNGWWRTNALGARHDREIAPRGAADRQRVLYFGDSYTQGSRLPQHAGYVSILNRLRPSSENLNFGVDGYSTGQAYLRYERVSGTLNFDAVVLMIVPRVDLWRDISVSRYIAEGWKTYKLQPRFRIQGEDLALVPSPFQDLASQIADGPDFRVARSHLLAHDAFYFPEYEPSNFSEALVLARVYRKAVATVKKRAIHAGIRSPESEAMQVTAGLVRRFRSETANDSFLLVILPIHEDLAAYRSEASFRAEWEAMTRMLCNAAGRCLDAMRPLLDAVPEELDYGHDGTHYGAKANQRIAEALLPALGSGSKKMAR